MADQNNMEGRLLNLQKEVNDLKAAFALRDPSFDKALKLFQQSYAAMTVIWVISAIAMGIQAFSIWQFHSTTRKHFEEAVEREKSKALLTFRVIPYAARIQGAIDRIKYGRTPVDRDSAIWEILETLKAAKISPYFYDIIPEFTKVLPYLKLDVKKKEFRDSYRGEVWISIFLLESSVEDIIRDVGKVLPPVEKIKTVLKENISNVLNEEDFRISVERLEIDLKQIKPKK